MRAVALDYRLGISYLASMATRLLLTLLALLTGLAAQLSPAQARIGLAVDTEIGEVSRGVAAQGRCTVAALTCLPLQRHASLSRTVAPFVPTEAAPAQPAVLQRIDRARE